MFLKEARFARKYLMTEQALTKKFVSCRYRFSELPIHIYLSKVVLGNVNFLNAIPTVMYLCQLFYTVLYVLCIGYHFRKHVISEEKIEKKTRNMYSHLYGPLYGKGTGKIFFSPAGHPVSIPAECFLVVFLGKQFAHLFCTLYAVHFVVAYGH